MNKGPQDREIWLTLPEDIRELLGRLVLTKGNTLTPGMAQNIALNHREDILDSVEDIQDLNFN